MVDNFAHFAIERLIAIASPEQYVRWKVDGGRWTVVLVRIGWGRVRQNRSFSSGQEFARIGWERVRQKRSSSE